ncbi:MAG: TolC family protein [Planctomycetes bacterium]|nr:TolC family protein [Planctomycetota bacterium]
MRSFTRPRLCVLVCMTAGVLALPLYPNGTHAAAQKPPENDVVKALLKERLVALAKIHDLTLQGFKGGQISYEKVLAAQSALLSGKLDLCETNAERIKTHEEMVKLAEEMVTAVRKLVEVKQATSTDLLKAEVQLLEARVGLERSKAAK